MSTPRPTHQGVRGTTYGLDRRQTLDLSQYGTPVTIHAPLASSVVSYKQYEKALRLISSAPALSI